MLHGVGYTSHSKTDDEICTAVVHAIMAWKMSNSSRRMILIHNIKHDINHQNGSCDGSDSDIHIYCILDKGCCPASHDLQLPFARLGELRALPIDPQIILSVAERSWSMHDASGRAVARPGHLCTVLGTI